MKTQDEILLTSLRRPLTYDLVSVLTDSQLYLLADVLVLSKAEVALVEAEREQRSVDERELKLYAELESRALSEESQLKRSWAQVQIEILHSRIESGANHGDYELVLKDLERIRRRELRLIKLRAQARKLTKDL